MSSNRTCNKSDTRHTKTGHQQQNTPTQSQQSPSDCSSSGGVNSTAHTADNPASVGAYRSKISPRTRSTAVVGPRSNGPAGSTVTHLPSKLPLSMMTRISHSMISSDLGRHGFRYSVPSFGFGGLASTFAMGSGAIAMRPSSSNYKLVTLNDNREKEKKDLSLLNDKFATYIEKIRFLEVQNRKLKMELGALENNTNQTGGCIIKSMYDTEMKSVHETINIADQSKAHSDEEYKKADAEYNNLNKVLHDLVENSGEDQNNIKELSLEIANNEAELNLLLRRTEDMKEELNVQKIIHRRIKDQITDINKALQVQMFEKNATDIKKDDLNEQLNAFLKTSQDELSLTSNAAQFELGHDSCNIFKNELCSAIQEIRKENQALIEEYRNSLRDKFHVTSSQIMMKRKRPTVASHQRDQVVAKEEQTKNTISLIRRDNDMTRVRMADLEIDISRLRTVIEEEGTCRDKMWAEKNDECGGLKEKLEEIDKEYNDIVNIKLTLEEEISQYRKLLEGTEGEAGLRQIVEKVEESAQRMQNEKLAAGMSAYSTSALPGTMVTDIRTTRIIGSTSSSTGGYGGVGGYGLGYSSGYNTGLGGGGRSGTYRGASSFDSAMGTGSSYTSGGGYGGGGTGSAAGYTSGYSSSSPHAPLLQRDRLEHTYHQSSDHTGPSPATTGASLSGSADVPSPYHSHNVSSNLARPSYRPSEQQSQSRSYHSESAKYGYNR